MYEQWICHLRAMINHSYSLNAIIILIARVADRLPVFNTKMLPAPDCTGVDDLNA